PSPSDSTTCSTSCGRSGSPARRRAPSKRSSPSARAPAPPRSSGPVSDLRWSSCGRGIREGHRRRPPVAHALQLLELGARGALGLGLSDVAVPALELAVAEVAAHLGLGDEPVDVI